MHLSPAKDSAMSHDLLSERLCQSLQRNSFFPAFGFISSDSSGPKQSRAVVSEKSLRHPEGSPAPHRRGAS